MFVNNAANSFFILLLSTLVIHLMRVVSVVVSPNYAIIYLARHHDNIQLPKTLQKENKKRIQLCIVFGVVFPVPLTQFAVRTMTCM